MNITIVGDGKVGRAILDRLKDEGHNIVVIDADPNHIEDIINNYDVLGVVGNGASYDIQREAGVKNADIFIAATSSDEINILSCLIAKNLGAKNTIGRIRNPEYSNQIDFVREELGISMTINPEYETAREIIKVLQIPNAITVETFARGKVNMVEILVDENSNLIGQTLLSIHKNYQVQILVCAVQRGDEVYIPRDGDFTIQAGDRLHVTASAPNIVTFFEKIGLVNEKISKVMIIGGGKIGYYLTDMLLKNNYHVKVIERDHARCKVLGTAFPKATIIRGDGTNQDILANEGIGEADAVISLTNIDEENILISMYAKKQGADKIVMKINRMSLLKMIETIGFASAIAPKDITADQILTYVRAKNNTRGNNIINLYRVVDDKVEALEFSVQGKADFIGIPLKDIAIRKDVLIAAIIRNKKIIIPNGLDTIELDDHVILVTTDNHLDDLSEIIE